MRECGLICHFKNGTKLASKCSQCLAVCVTRLWEKEQHRVSSETLLQRGFGRCTEPAKVPPWYNGVSHVGILLSLYIRISVLLSTSVCGHEAVTPGLALKADSSSSARCICSV